MKFKILNLLCFLLFFNAIYSQTTQRNIYKCIDTFTLKDSCIYLRDFTVQLTSTKHQSFNVGLNANTKYLFLLCGGKFVKKAPDAKLRLYNPNDSTLYSPIQEASPDSSFIFKCEESGKYIVDISAKYLVKYGYAVGILYYMGKF